MRSTRRAVLALCLAWPPHEVVRVSVGGGMDLSDDEQDPSERDELLSDVMMEFPAGPEEEQFQPLSPEPLGPEDEIQPEEETTASSEVAKAEPTASGAVGVVPDAVLPVTDPECTTSQKLPSMEPTAHTSTPLVAARMENRKLKRLNEKTTVSEKVCPPVPLAEPDHFASEKFEHTETWGPFFGGS